MTTRRLLVRGTPAQIAQIQSLLEKLGETADAALALTAEASDRSVRVLPITGTEAQAVLEQIQQIWPSVRSNQIRTVTPSAVIRSVYPRRLAVAGPRRRDRRSIVALHPANVRCRHAGDTSWSASAALRDRRGGGRGGPTPRPSAPRRAWVVPRSKRPGGACPLDATQMLAQVALPAESDRRDSSGRLGRGRRRRPAAPVGRHEENAGEASPSDDEPGADIVIAVGPPG